jgi:Flp pilus assembly protein TadD
VSADAGHDAQGTAAVHGLAEVEGALARGDHETVLRMTDAILAAHPGDDAAHEHRARALLGLGRLEEAERHAQDAVRLDPEEVRYRELLALVLSAVGAHRDAADEYRRLARNDPHQATWTVAEAEERIDASEPARGVDAAARAVRLEPANGRAQLALANALTRTGDARGAVLAARRASELLPGDPGAREALADAIWLADRDASAFTEFRDLVEELTGADRERVMAKARALYRQHAGWLGRAVTSVGPAFALAFSRGWLKVDQ